jgi:FkbM family methyltransferase
MIQFIREFVTVYAPDIVFIPLVNLNNTLKRRRAYIRLQEPNIYSIDDGVQKIYCARRSRLGRYFFGVQNQCNKLSQEYLLDKIVFSENDIVIDCGANNGEIGVWAKAKNLKYYAFDPEPFEARCCDLNNFQGEKKTYRKGLWSEKTTLNWYSKPESADSSLIEIASPVLVQSIETTTLDDFVQEHNIPRIRLLKLEAEGAEPEVLKGALNILDQIDYIAAECGYERGIKEDHTFVEVYNILRERNFFIIAAEFKRGVFLFKRQDI